MKRWKGIEEMSKVKLERRRELARLPFEKKIDILIQLQRIAKGVRKHRRVWYEGH